MSKENVEIYFGAQAEMLLKQMPKIKKDALVKWFANVRRISIGGGDVCEYLKYLKEKKGDL